MRRVTGWPDRPDLLLFRSASAEQEGSRRAGLRSNFPTAGRQYGTIRGQSAGGDPVLMRGSAFRLVAALGLAGALTSCASQPSPTAPGPAVTASSVSVSGSAPVVGASAQFSATATLSN